MSRVAACFLPLLLAVALIGQPGCALMKLDRISKKLTGGEPETILQSDVGAPPEMESRHSTGIDHDGDTLVGGCFTYRGNIEETDAFAKDVSERYTSRGWTAWQTAVNPRNGNLIFRKDDRQVEVDFTVSTIEPAMSRATVTVSRIAASAPAAQPAQGAVSRGPA